jgi:hypothetical protein
MLTGMWIEQVNWRPVALLACLLMPCLATAQTKVTFGQKASVAAWGALANLPDFSGVWEVTRGRNGYGAPVEPPQLTPKYAQLNAAYRANPPQDSAAANCVPPGMPGVMTQPYPVEFLLTPGKVTVVAEAYMQVRHIYTDGRPHPEDPDPTYNGHSIGKWEKGTLVVDTVGFVDSTMLNAGMKHSAKMHIVERMRLADANTLEIVTTIDDAEALSKPWSRTTVYARHRDWTTSEYICQENNRNFVDQTGKAGIDLSR